jgi:hypothetical protein
MNDQLLERIRDLERTVRRWRLACLALVLFIVSLIAIGGTVGIMVMIDLPSRNELQMQEMQARRQAERALAAERAARQQLEQQKQQAQREQTEP